MVDMPFKISCPESFPAGSGPLINPHDHLEGARCLPCRVPATGADKAGLSPGLLSPRRGAPWETGAVAYAAAVCGTKSSGVELTSFCPSVSGTNKNETSFGLEMSQTGFSSHVVEVRTGSEPPSTHSAPRPAPRLSWAVSIPLLSLSESLCLPFSVAGRENQGLQQ